MYRWKNNGGWNKRNGCIERTARVDSFELADTTTWGGLVCGGKWLETYHDDLACTLFTPAGEVEVELSFKPNGYGGSQTFFLCPACGTRVRYLYQAGATFLCRKCFGLNYRSQQETKSGTMYFYRKGTAFVEKHFDCWPEAFPDGFNFSQWTPARPRYMHGSTFRRYLRRLRIYQRRHEQRQIAELK